jgi:hypothetical protein
MEEIRVGAVVPPNREVVVFDDDLQFPYSDSNSTLQAHYKHDFK